MSRLGDLLELMHTAHSRPRSVRGVFREWCNTDLWQVSARRYSESQRPGSIATSHLMGTDVVGDARISPRIEERVHRVWRRNPGAFWRVESDPGHGQDSDLAILNEGRWWGSFAGQGVVTNVRPDGSIVPNVGGQVPSRFFELIFDPAAWLVSLNIQPGEDSSQAGRAGLGAVGPWRRGINLGLLDWPFADEVRLLLDAEFGLVLRLEMFLDGVLFIRWQAEEVAFNEDLPDSLFNGPSDAQLPRLPDLSGLPPGTRQRIRGSWHRRHEDDA